MVIDYGSKLRNEERMICDWFHVLNGALAHTHTHVHTTVRKINRIADIFASTCICMCMLCIGKSGISTELWFNGINNFLVFTPFNRRSCCWIKKGKPKTKLNIDPRWRKFVGNFSIANYILCNGSTTFTCGFEYRRRRKRKMFSCNKNGFSLSFWASSENLCYACFYYLHTRQRSLPIPFIRSSSILCIWNELKA